MHKIADSDPFISITAFELWQLPSGTVLLAARQSSRGIRDTCDSAHIAFGADSRRRYTPPECFRIVGGGRSRSLAGT